MDYIKTIVPKNKFNIYEFYKHIDADDREEAEDNFKSLIKQLLLLPDNPEDKLTKRLKQFAKKVKKYKYRVLDSRKAIKYWADITMLRTFEKKALLQSMVEEKSIDDLIADTAKRNKEHADENQ